MAGSGYDVDPAVLKTQGGVFEDIGSDFGESAKKLKATLKEAEEWGSDEFVKIFNDFYKPVSEGIAESMPHLGEEISKIGSKLQAMGAHYDSTEREQHDHLAKYAAHRPNIAN
ncbi:hypothetical protein [Streptomyces decoyicus]|uniref:hypothetical protein n=1 Tax=Streptomyces decoyicus TaxID=249567 RepID=UPI0004AAB542|nr:hypothetical protein [Streptomyces decoyicus]KOG39410.1 hypothetical protein ADK74_29330 [Streptomyces decoyicus]QZY18193.1 hypothetical protein K7C20_25550 [Streptomyces decoyicus]